VAVIAIHVAQQSAQLFKRRRVEAPMLFQAVLRASLELVQVPTCLGDADNWHVERAAFNHRLQRWENLLVSQVASGTEKDQRIGMGITHRVFLSTFSKRSIFMR